MLPRQRWQIAAPVPDLAARLAGAFGLSPLVAQVLINRGITTCELAEHFLSPDSWVLPEPGAEFAQMGRAVELLAEAIVHNKPIAICGDYDCDGMTSTALLLRAVRALGGQIDYAIPSRMHEGYGINCRIVEEFFDRGVGLILTVDNGISAHGPIARAAELGMQVIVTDHHDLPDVLPVADAILNPKLMERTSPYAYLAGVGVAFVLAGELARRFEDNGDLQESLLELFTLGTVADLAPLVGVNRAWVLRGLARLPGSTNPGVQALLAVCGLLGRNDLKPEAIGFALGPRINAVGRIGDPVTVIELLTTDDPAVAAERAGECEQANQRRQVLCAQIEAEAIALVEAQQKDGLDLAQQRVLVLAQPGWHHGVIGIVASRLKERYGAPVFIAAIEGERVRGSARGIPEFHIYEALKFCADLLDGFGGHPMAGGFSLRGDQLEAFKVRLQDFARARLQPEQIAPLVEIDAAVQLAQINRALVEQLDRLQPCGLGNREPVFWVAGARVVQQKAMGKEGTHLQLLVSDGTAERRAVGWRQADYLPLPEFVDIAFSARRNEYQGTVKIELEVAGLRAATAAPFVLPAPPAFEESIEWHDHREGDGAAFLATFVPDQQRPVLLYGHERPQLPPGWPVHYDRPQENYRYEHLLLWSLPPSPLHLLWLLAVVRPRTVHLFAATVPAFHPWKLRHQLQASYRPGLPFEILRLSQHCWVSPRIVCEALVEERFLEDWRPVIDANLHGWLGAERLQLAEWYQSRADVLQELLRRPASLLQPLARSCDSLC
ncbi:single-stranded-DNA-specific exonuclease RecJ [Gloeobacter kilaueensis]|uniref:Single-stranded-DNA-specific exonuclease RecJ n=1 Tax=Gloeobacter kilaueensis (strain ATCC BAA-2537 / CCAP 1431/1 / ULC 316 / JS1) TaxID=1183438 RepID=U5QPD9_GLOK1|nr:single-stranded-DNA-specific exonuclease RecJ [Gloeobacter kilaueensis]AGY59464.1 single-stranded-DNA-specific exonuclease RecJ [Gloeobacter kilaueensis JS1]